MFKGFHRSDVEANGVRLRVHQGGEGPPLLLLHGYPQTHAMWHAVAPRLAESFSVVLADLRGYGASSKPPGGTNHANYAKRVMAEDTVELMTRLGHKRFMVAGHDRGGRVTHRMCLDHPDRVERAAVLDIVPTLTLFDRIDQVTAKGYYHWFFLAQPAPLPERMIGADPEFFLRTKLGAWSAGRDDFFNPEAVDAYLEAFRNPETIRATCEDYRAAATIDLEHDRADEAKRIECPLLVLWGVKGLMHRSFDMLDVWREKAVGPVTGRALDTGHFLAEEAPEETVDELERFFAG